jgi:hypothetical protein
MKKYHINVATGLCCCIFKLDWFGYTSNYETKITKISETFKNIVSFRRWTPWIGKTSWNAHDLPQGLFDFTHVTYPQAEIQHLLIVRWGDIIVTNSSTVNYEFLDTYYALVLSLWVVCKILYKDPKSLPSSLPTSKNRGRKHMNKTSCLWMVTTPKWRNVKMWCSQEYNNLYKGGLFVYEINK